MIGIGLTALVALSRYFLYFHDQFAVGNDGYFYALQLKYLLSSHSLLYPDPSLAYGFLAGVSRLTGTDPVVATKLAGIIAAVASVALFILIAHRFGYPLLALLPASAFFGLSRSHLFLDLEFIKNAIGIVVYLLFLLSLTARSKNIPKDLVSLGLMFACLAFHKLAFALAVLSYLPWLVWRIGGTWRRRAYCLTAGLLGLLALFLLINQSTQFIKAADMNRLAGFLAWSGPGDRWQAFMSAPITWLERAEYLVLHATPLGLLWLVLSDQGQASTRKAFLLSQAFLGLVLVFPFYRWSFDGFAFRLLIAAWIPAAFFLLELARRGIEYRPKLGKSASLFLSLLIVAPLHADTQALHQNGRYPDYTAAWPAIRSLPMHVKPGTRLVARRGIAPFIWYTAGIPTITFSPRGETGHWQRLMFGFSPELIAPYLQDTDLPLVRLSDSYTLVDEKTWDRFYQAKKGKLRYLDNPDNPTQTRPSFALRYRASLVDP